VPTRVNSSDRPLRKETVPFQQYLFCALVLTCLEYVLATTMITLILPSSLRRTYKTSGGSTRQLWRFAEFDSLPISYPWTPKLALPRRGFTLLYLSLGSSERDTMLRGVV
jgi:hypothetical protein